MEQTGTLSSRITVNINKCDKIVSTKSSNFNLLLKSEYSGRIINESSKIQCSDETVTCDYSVLFSVNINDINTANELSNNPVVVYAYEILPKEKKQKEEKMNLLGHFVIDLMEIIENMHVEGCANLVPNESVYSDDLFKAAHNSKFNYEINCTERLFTEQLLYSWSRLSFTVGSLYGLPEATNIPGNIFIASLLLPTGDQVIQKEELGIYFDGQVKQPSEKPNYDKKYPKLSTLSKRLYHKTKIAKYGLKCSLAEMKDVPSGKDRSVLQKETARVQWNIEINFYLDPEGITQLRRDITKNRFLPLEICALSSQQNPKGKKIDDDFQVIFHGVSYINLWSLLYPGEKDFNGAFLVKPFDETELIASGGRRRVLTDEFVNSSYTAFMAPGQSKTRKDDKKEAKKMASKTLISPFEKSEISTWEEGRSFITVECEIDKPMIVKRTREDLAESVYKYILEKRPKPKQETLAEKAVDDFREVIAEVSDSVLVELGKLVEYDKDAETWDNKMAYKLNSSDIYYEIKEKVKFAIINIVREKFLRKSKIVNENELNNFLSDLYVFLMDQIHIALNKKVSSVKVVSEPQPSLSIEQLELFTEEAISINRFDLATEYLRQILARVMTSANTWLKLATVALGKEDLESALYYAEESLYHDPANYDGQIFSAILTGLSDNYDRAEEIMQYNVELNPENDISLIILGLVYEQIGNELKAEMAFRYALKDEHKRKTSREMSKDSSSKKSSHCSVQIESSKIEQSKHTNDNAFLMAAQYLFSLNLILYAEKSMSKIFGSKSADYNILLCRIALFRRNYDEFDKLIEALLVDLIEEPVIWALIGHSFYERGRNGDAVDAYNRYIDMVGDKIDQHAVLLRLGEIYLTEGKFNEAKYNYKLATQENPTHLTWLGLGISCYRIGEIEEAEMALCEANCLNSLDFQAWSYLCLICLGLQRKMEAEQAFKYAIRLGLRESSELYEEVTQMLEQVGFGNPQFNF